MQKNNNLAPKSWQPCLNIYTLKYITYYHDTEGGQVPTNKTQPSYIVQNHMLIIQELDDFDSEKKKRL